MTVIERQDDSLFGLYRACHPEGAQRPKDLFNENGGGEREGGRDPSLDAQDDSLRRSG